jgi:hypothetical protein
MMGVYNKILWSFKSTAEIICLCLATLYDTSAEFRCNHIIDIKISIYHGKGYSYAVLKVTLLIPDIAWALE